MDNDEVAELIKYIELIDVAMNEIYQLMRKDSYIRFISTEHYSKFIQQIPSKERIKHLKSSSWVAARQ